MRILFLAPRFPLPATKGDKLRAWQFIQALASEHEVTLAAYIAGEEERARLPEVEAVCRVVWTRFRTGLQVARMLAAARGGPFQTALFTSPAMRRHIASLLPEHDVVHANTLRMVGNLPATADSPLVVDFIDALSLAFERHGAGAPAFMRPWYRAEARRLRCLEQRLQQRAALSFAISPQDAEALGGSVEAVPHSIDTRLFKPAEPDANAAAGNEPAIVLSGNLAYPPNVEGAVWFVREVLPRLEQAAPAAHVRLVGISPARRVRALASRRVTVTGEVPSVAAELQRAAVAAAPVFSGAGVKTKVLEAMGCGAPVVATTFANLGIGAEDGREILLADTPEAFARAVSELLRDRERAAAIGAAGRALVEDRFSWEHANRKLLELYLGVSRRLASDSREARG